MKKTIFLSLVAGAVIFTGCGGGGGGASSSSGGASSSSGGASSSSGGGSPSSGGGAITLTCPSEAPTGTTIKVIKTGQADSGVNSTVTANRVFTRDAQTNTVTDPDGLVWADSYSNGVTDPAANADAANSTRTYSEAVAFCSDAGMRLPSVQEALNLVDFNNYEVDDTFIAGGDQSVVWAKDQYLVYLTGGQYEHVSTATDLNSKRAVRCVEKGKTIEFKHTADTTTSGITKDKVSGLEWSNFQVEAGTNTYTFPLEGNATTTTAAQYCANLALDGGGWRLPSINELRSMFCINSGEVLVQNNTAGSVVNMVSSTKSKDGTKYLGLSTANKKVVYYNPADGTQFYVTCTRDN